jgi:hypothetical protein
MFDLLYKKILISFPLTFIVMSMIACAGSEKTGDELKNSQVENLPELLSVPPPPPDTAFLALITPEQTAQIRALGLPLVLPTAIPDGFGVVQLLTQSDDRFGGYQVLYPRWQRSLLPDRVHHRRHRRHPND